MRRKYFKRIAAFLSAVIVLTGSGQFLRPIQVLAEEPMKINYSGFSANNGWSRVTDDNKFCAAPEGSYLTAIKANLLNQPKNLTGTVKYQVNLSGSGWLDPAENGEHIGETEGQMPLEAVKMELTGGIGENYDIYYSVLQSGIWTPWAMNGSAAGTEGAGLRVDGIRISVTAKGGALPIPAPETILPGSVYGQRKMGEIDPSKPMIALTFDDGPNSPVTNRILDTLEANGARATFFMVGNRVTGKANKASTERMVKLGCEVGNHTFDHRTITSLTAEGVRFQLSQTNQVVKDVSSVAPLIMRPPGGAKNSVSMEAVGSLGMSAVLWSVDTLDWKTKDKQKTIDAILGQVKDGDIILMHDLYSTTADAVEVVVPQLIKQGYQLVTVSELAGYRGGMTAGKAYSSFR